MSLSHPGLKWRKVTSNTIFYVMLALILCVMLFPFYWMIITSLKFESEIFNFTRNPLWVSNPSLQNYVVLFQTPLFTDWVLNSTIVAIGTTAFSLVLAVPAGYAIAKLNFPGVTVIATLIFITYLVPKTLLFVPIAQFMGQLGLLGGLSALFLSFPTFMIPFCTWLLIGFFRGIPNDLEECAMIDGCSRIGAIVRITLPLAVPGILTAGIFAFTLSWNELLYPLVLLSGDANKTLPLGVMSNLSRSDYYFWGPLMAASTIASIPIAILFFFFMDLYVSGITAGAVKG